MSGRRRVVPLHDVFQHTRCFILSQCKRCVMLRDAHSTLLGALLLGWASTATAANPCFDPMPTLEAIEAADAAWIGMPEQGAGQNAPYVPVLPLRGTPAATTWGSSLMVVLVAGPHVCVRELIPRGLQDASLAQTILSMGATAEPLTGDVVAAAAFHGQSPVNDPVAREVILPRVWNLAFAGTEVSHGSQPLPILPERPTEGAFWEVSGAIYGPLALVSLDRWADGCPVDGQVVVFGFGEYGAELRFGRHRELRMPLSCMFPDIESDCVVVSDGGIVYDVPLGGACPEGSVPLAYGGQPFCMDVTTCETVPFVGMESESTHRKKDRRRGRSR